MRLDVKDTPLFLSDNALLSGGVSNHSDSEKNKEQVRIRLPSAYFCIVDADSLPPPLFAEHQYRSCLRPASKKLVALVCISAVARFSARSALVESQAWLSISALQEPK